MKRKLTRLLLILLFSMLIVSAVNAQDNNQTDDISTFDGETSMNLDEEHFPDSTTPNDEISFDKDQEVLSAHNEDTLSATLSLTSLQNLISNSGNYVSLQNDYKAGGYDYQDVFINGKSSLVIEGNGHTIDLNNRQLGIFLYNNNVVLNNITFINSKSVALRNYGYNCTLTNCKFISNEGTQASAVQWISSSGLIENVTFIENSANTIGAMAVVGHNNKLNNLTFINNSAAICGALYFGPTYDGITSQGNRLTNSTFISNKANGGFEDEYIQNSNGGGFAGSIYNSADGTIVENTIFRDNYVASGSGAGFYTILAENIRVNNCTFEDNTAIYATAVYINGRNVLVNNSRFYNNDAYDGGAILIKGENINVSNSKFKNNHAIYGGGAITSSTKDSSSISNCEFENNSAGNYGGALSIWNMKVDNSTFKNNSALFGGAIYTVNSTIKDSIFENNNAISGQSVFAVDASDLQSDVPENETINKHHQNIVQASEIQHEFFINLTNGYSGFCAEFHNAPPQTSIQIDNMTIMRNALNHEDVSEHLKILFYVFIDHIDDVEKLGIQQLVWIFTNGDYENSDNEKIIRTIELYDSGFRVPNTNAEKLLANGTLMIYNFASVVTPAEEQNMFVFKIEYKNETNQTVDKKVLNKTIIVGDEFYYEITVRNTGTEPLTNVFIEDIDFTSNIRFIRAVNGTGTWEFKNDTIEVFKFKFQNLTESDFRNVSARWVLTTPLLRNQNASIILVFKALSNGTAVNNVTSGFENLDMCNDTNKTRIYIANLTVEKISLTPTVEMGNQTEFEIVVKNTGEVGLKKVFVEELSFDGLIYEGWHENPQWTFSNSTGKPRWYFNGELPVGEVANFIAIFNTTTYGNFTNVVVVKSNKTDNQTGNNTTKVLKPDFTVKKNVLTPYVVVGNQTKFEIIVKNTGEVNLDDIVVIEDSYYGLVYDHADTGDLWDHLLVNGKHAWKLKTVLAPGEEEYFFVYFNTTRVGNFTNYVVATSNKTDNKTGNNTTVVNQTVPAGGYHSDFTVEKITINKTVVIGELVEFQIIVKNTGNATIHNLTIIEKEFEGLTYVRYTDHFDFWQFHRDEMSWRLRDDFYPGEEIAINVFFNTTRTGNFINTVVVTSNETDNKTGNNTTKVLKPGINIEKVAINKTVRVGEQAVFEILVHNTGEEVLHDILVRELDFEGLIYDHFMDYSGFWVKNDDLSWTLNRPLAVGEYEGFFIVFNATQRGNFTNIASVHANETNNDTDNDTVRVLGYDLTVSKNTLNKKVLVGENVEFEITVKNTGDLVLEDVFVVESKYDSGLVYQDYHNVNGDWSHILNEGRNTFLLRDSLKVGESASFRIIFKTTQTGNMSNTVEAGYNNTTVANSTNVTEIFNLTNETDEKINRTVPPKHDEIIEKNQTDIQKSKEAKIVKANIDRKATGNPLIVLILALMFLPLRRFNR